MKIFEEHRPHYFQCKRLSSPASNASGVLLQFLWWREEDSNLRSRPTTDLQSVPFSHSGIPPGKISTTIKWSWRWDSNPQPADYKSAALPVELRQQALCTIQILFYELFVGNEDTRYSSLYIPCQDFLAKKISVIAAARYNKCYLRRTPLLFSAAAIPPLTGDSRSSAADSRPAAASAFTTEPRSCGR